MRRRSLLVLSPALFAPALSSPALAQSWNPQHTLRIIVPFPGGGTIDLVARVLAPILQQELGQAVIVENRPGAAGLVGSRFASRRLGDGHTILCAGLGSLTAPFMRRRPGYDPERDFRPVILLASVPTILVTRPDFPARTVQDWHRLVQAAPPGSLAFSSAGVGAVQHLAAELYRSMTGANIVHIPYLGGAPSLAELAASRVDFSFADAGAAAPMVEYRILPALALGGRHRMLRFPGLSTLDETVLPGFEASTWCGFWLPASASDAMAARWNAAANKALAHDVAAERMFAAGFISEGGTEEAARAHRQAEARKWRRLIRERNIRSDTEQ
jgi:tripartite-type tricarboxylate transporter receptor subunit TctC